jgi:hypothetical protein
MNHGFGDDFTYFTQAHATSATQDGYLHSCASEEMSFAADGQGRAGIAKGGEYLATIFVALLSEGLSGGPQVISKLALLIAAARMDFSAAAAHICSSFGEILFIGRRTSSLNGSPL